MDISQIIYRPTECALKFCNSKKKREAGGRGRKKMREGRKRKDNSRSMLGRSTEQISGYASSADFELRCERQTPWATSLHPPRGGRRRNRARLWESKLKGESTTHEIYLFIFILSFVSFFFFRVLLFFLIFRPGRSFPPSDERCMQSLAYDARREIWRFRFRSADRCRFFSSGSGTPCPPPSPSWSSER